MSQKEHIKSLLLKFSRNRCSKNEVAEIINYFQNNPEEQALPEVQEVLQQLILEKSFRRRSKIEMYAKIENKIRYKKALNLPQKSNNRKLWLSAIAAIFISILSGSLFLYLTGSKQANQIAAKDSIILEREDGTITSLLEKGQLQLTNSSGKIIGGQKGKLLVYQKQEQASTKIEYNTLRIPNGKRFNIQLSDGSQVFMNAGSSLKYPVNFSRTNKREVFLTGEAFFKVAKDRERPFKVRAKDLEIGVLGTEFNVSAYPEDTIANVVLVEGAVALNTKQQQKTKSFLKPGQLASLTTTTGNLEISEVKTSIYTSWMQGNLVFRNISFEDILKKMERHYGVSIINKNKAIAKEKFNASFGQEPLHNILEYFKKTYGLHYTQKCDTKIIINPKTKR